MSRSTTIIVRRRQPAFDPNQIPDDDLLAAMVLTTRIAARAELIRRQRITSTLLQWATRSFEDRS